MVSTSFLLFDIEYPTTHTDRLISFLDRIFRLSRNLMAACVEMKLHREPPEDVDPQMAAQRKMLFWIAIKIGMLRM